MYVPSLRWTRLFAVSTLFTLAACSSSSDSDSCQPDDADGVMGGSKSFVVTVDDEEFSPKILTAQNRAPITLQLTNEGTTPHGFTIGCIPTELPAGCPQESCFTDGATIPPLEPGESATAEFDVPLVEGLHTITTGVDGDAPEAQFVVE